MARQAHGAEWAEADALAMLGWIAGHPELLETLMAAAGTDSQGLRHAAREPEFLGFVVDFLLADEAALLACCADLGQDPARALAVRAHLPGGDLPHWT